jgi:hypothetical protein
MGKIIKNKIIVFSMISKKYGITNIVSSLSKKNNREMGRMFNCIVYLLKLYLYMREKVGAVIPAPTDHSLHYSYDDVG